MRGAFCLESTRIECSESAGTEAPGPGGQFADRVGTDLSTVTRGRVGSDGVAAEEESRGGVLLLPSGESGRGRDRLPPRRFTGRGSQSVVTSAPEGEMAELGGAPAR